MKKWIYRFILLGLACGLVEAASLKALRFIRKKTGTRYTPVDQLADDNKKALGDLLAGKTKYIVFSPELGWTLKPNGHKSLYYANAAGIRGNKEYPLDPDSNVVRVACFGDSFTHGDDVANEWTWPAQLERQCKQTEVINFGVQGYGLDQAYLRYTHVGAAYKPNLVFIGYMTENISRNVNTFRPFYYPRTNIPLFKPRYTMRENRLELLPNPIPRLEDYQDLLGRPHNVLTDLGSNDFFYQHHYKSSFFDFSAFIRLMKMTLDNVRSKNEFGILKNGAYNENSEAFQVTTHIFDAFYQDVIAHHATPIIIIFPRMDDVETYRANKTKGYAPLLSYFDSKGYAYIDAMNAFQSSDPNYNVNTWFVHGGHYSNTGNKYVANYIASFLKEKGMVRE